MSRFDTIKEMLKGLLHIKDDSKYKPKEAEGPAHDKVTKEFLEQKELNQQHLDEHLKQKDEDENIANIVEDNWRTQEEEEIEKEDQLLFKPAENYGENRPPGQETGKAYVANPHEQEHDPNAYHSNHSHEQKKFINKSIRIYETEKFHFSCINSLKF